MQMLVMPKKPMQSGPLQKNSKCKFGANAILYNAMLGSANVANVIPSLQSWNQPFRSSDVRKDFPINHATSVSLFSLLMPIYT